MGTIHIDLALNKDSQTYIKLDFVILGWKGRVDLDGYLMLFELWILNAF